MLTTNHRLIDTNGIKMHIAEQGQGRLVILCHGFPECWYSWRHQLQALASAGFHVVAPDLRGYGQTDQPESVEAYNIFNIVGDIVGLVHALNQERAIIVGHDWGASIAWHCALLRPDIFNAIALLSVPYHIRTWKSRRPTTVLKQMAGGQQFYIQYFQEQGLAEAELEVDVRKTMSMVLYSASGDAPPEKRWRYVFDKSEKFIDTLSQPSTLPAWLTEQDLDYFTNEFKRTGFRGGLSYYRNMDRNWENTPFLSGAKLHQPALFIGGEVDPTITLNRDVINIMETTVPNLKNKVLLPNAGHWIQQERPREVNQLLIDFLKSNL
ncbi:epoxide hydrolase [Rivularia sp. IAM M-261]|nr:epoxide hydrolase [Calothrix sp. PCC 7716]GJD21022.1 epoxide hydrolase [Rivularia sp. IAM M-261]